VAVRLLLDAHIHPQLAGLLRGRGIDAESAIEWREGGLASAPDLELLAVAREDRRTLVTFDVGSVPALIRQLTEAGVEHAGVLFISTKTYMPEQIGPLAEALVRFLASLPDEDLLNQTRFLPK